MGEVDPSRHHVKILIWQYEEGVRLNEMVKKWGRENFVFHEIFLRYIFFVENLIG